MPADSPMFHSTGCSRYAPFVMWVTPRFLPPGSRLSMRTGIIEPSGIWNGQLPGRFGVARALRLVDADHRAEPVVVLRPAHHGDVAVCASAFSDVG
jgi:hypothetical protein